MTSSFRDRFDRVDGPIGGNYLVPCGQVTIFDGAVLPVTDGEGNSGLSPVLDGTTDEKTQVFYVAEAMDRRDYVVRCVWSHDSSILGERPLSDLLTLTDTDPAFTVLARMTKDPMLIDLGRDQDPACYDQGYGVRITCPRAGTVPTLKLVKYMPPAVPPGIARPTSTEPDGAVVLASVTLQAANLNLDPDWDSTGNPPYRGFVQETRIRIRRADQQVFVEVFHNDRNMNTPVLDYTDRQDPAWGDIGLPGFEFLSPRLTPQPANVSPYELAALPVMRCHLFEAQTIRAFSRPVSVTPSNVWSYRRVVERVILLVEKDGDARYTATGSGSKLDTYLQFVVEAESHIIREVGYWPWARRSGTVYLADGRSNYELPADVDLVSFIQPSWNSQPLNKVDPFLFHNRLAGIERTGGRPTAYRDEERSVNDRPVIRVSPVPTIGAAGTSTADDHLIVEYFARQIYPDDIDAQIPMVPQAHMDTLIYGATAHALLLDTDAKNAQQFAQTFASKLKGLKRMAHREVSAKQSVMRSASDVFIPNVRSRIPLLRATQLETLLPFS